MNFSSLLTIGRREIYFAFSMCVCVWYLYINRSESYKRRPHGSVRSRPFTNPYTYDWGMLLSTYQSYQSIVSRDQERIVVQLFDIFSLKYGFNILNRIPSHEIYFRLAIRRRRDKEREERETEGAYVRTRSGGFIETAYLFRDIACLPAY